MRPEAFELLVANAFHLAKVLDFREETVRHAVFDDPLGQLRANARQRFQIGRGRPIQVDPS
jgi:hypothetical protein